jgi:hypothetical protein
VALINKELLIALIEERPVLWDKSDDTNKDRNATKEAWNEVCLQNLFSSVLSSENGVWNNPTSSRLLIDWVNPVQSFLLLPFFLSASMKIPHSK